MGNEFIDNLVAQARKEREAIPSTGDVLPEEIPEKVSEEELTSAAQEAEKMVIQAKEREGLTGDYKINPFEEAKSMEEIMYEKLCNVSDNEEYINKAMRTFSSSLEKMNKAVLSKEARNLQCDLLIDALKADQEFKRVDEEVADATRDALLHRRYGDVGANTMKRAFAESIIEKFGPRTADKVLRSMSPQEYVNAVIEFDSQQKKDYYMWKQNNNNHNNKNAPPQSNPYVEKVYKTPSLVDADKFNKTAQDIANFLEKYGNK